MLRNKFILNEATVIYLGAQHCDNSSLKDHIAQEIAEFQT